MAAQLIAAAQYLRMSSEMQQYSLENQADTITQYAATNGFRSPRLSPTSQRVVSHVNTEEDCKSYCEKQ